MKITIIGDIVTVRGFGFIGIDGKVVYSAEEARQELKLLLNSNNVGLILVAQSFATQLGTEFDEYKLRKHLPLVLDIPDSQGAEAATSLQELVQKSLGLKL